MKKVNLLFLTIIIISLNLSIASAQDCSKLEKLSKEYAECNANIVKKKISTKINDGKEKFNKSKFKETLIKFKNSKNHKEFMEKIKNDS